MKSWKKEIKIVRHPLDIVSLHRYSIYLRNISSNCHLQSKELRTNRFHSKRIFSLVQEEEEKGLNRAELAEIRNSRHPSDIVYI